MAILTSKHLFAQADGLLALFPKRKPRQTELRRAVSTAYYGLYHFVPKQAADEFVGARYGKTLPPAAAYVLAYRSISHSAISPLCSELKKSNLPQKLKAFGDAGRFGSDIRRFSTLFVDLQERRHIADYDISATLTRAEAVLAVNFARNAVENFEAIPKEERRIFLALLLFPPHGKS